MARIYGTAKSVMLWFGESAEGSDLALEAIGRAAQTRLAKPLLTRELCNDVLREVSLAAKTFNHNILLKGHWTRELWATYVPMSLAAPAPHSRGIFLVSSNPAIFHLHARTRHIMIPSLIKSTPSYINPIVTSPFTRA